MTIISIEAATAGMTVSDNVLTPEGAVFITKGTCLTQSLLDGLRVRGIFEIQVISATTTGTNGPAGNIEVNLIEQRFRNVRGNEIMETLLAAVMEYQMKDGNGHGA